MAEPNHVVRTTITVRSHVNAMMGAVRERVVWAAGTADRRLRDVLRERLPLDFDFEYDPPEIGTVWESDDSLWQPILALAAQRIDCHTAAQALLMQAGKWAPVREMPEAQ
jgi:hypothetical protein